MQYVHDNEKKQLEMAASRPFWILFLQNLLSLCEPYILFYIHGPAILLCL